jgi:hypothetical protein
VVQQAPAPVLTPAPPPQVAAPVFKGLAPDMEQRARDILNQVISNTKGATLPVLATQPPKATPIIPPPQTTPEPQPTTPTPSVVRGPDAPAVVTPAKPATATPIAPDQEAKARELLNKLLTQPAPAPTSVEKPQPKPAPAPVVTAKPPEAAPVTSKPAPAPQPQSPTIPADQEAKAREILNQTLATLPAPTPAPAPAPTTATTVDVQPVPAVDRRAQEDARRQAKLKAEIEEQTRREIARMEEESQARAREMAKRRLEEERRAQRNPAKTDAAPSAMAKPAPTAVRNAPESTQVKPATVKPAEKPRRAKNDSNGKGAAKPPVEETWKSADKPREQRLAELLDAYRKDQISAQQYHSDRAKILGAP